MNRIILISHNELAQGMKKAVEMIAGPQKNLEVHGLMPGEQPDVIMNHIKQSIKTTENVIILADIIGGSMCNAAMTLLPLKNVRIIGGMNLAIVLEVVLNNPKTDADLQHLIQGAVNNLQEVKLEKIKDESFF